MLDSFSRLKERARELGNHHRKYLHLVATKKDLLIERLEASGAIDEVHLWSAAPDVSTEMDLVKSVGRDLDEQLTFLGCYLAFQLLNLNLRAIDVLPLQLSSQTDRFRVYREFMLQMGADLRRIIASYMEKVLDLFLPPEQQPEFVICGVGTRADQDDLDLGIVDDGSPRRDAFNHAIGKLQREMLRRAIPLHFHLSEHVGEQSFSASIEEYVALLDREIQDFIVVTEMLGARRILGSRALFRRFTREVTDRYYYTAGGDNRFHEGYLRGMLGEVRSLQLWELKRDSIDPKRDALRVIKGIIAAQKTVFGVEEANAWEIIDRLRARNPSQRDRYDELEHALSFVEVFRFLYQLVEVQEEEIPLREDVSRAKLESVASLMGYQDVGVVRAYDHLLIHYHEHVQAARSVATSMLGELRVHLEEVSVLSGLLRSRQVAGHPDGAEENLAVRFVNALRFFRGTKFWDDVMAPLEAEDGELLRAFVRSFEELPEQERGVWIQRYAKWGEATFIAVFRLFVVLYKHRDTMDSLPLLRQLSEAFLDRITPLANSVPRLTAIFHGHPRLLHDFLLCLEPDQKLRLVKLLEGPVWSEEGDLLRRKTLHFCRLHIYTSHYFKRFLQRIVQRFPEYVDLFDQPQRLKVISNGLFARIENVQSFGAKKDELGVYYDLEFLRVGLECIAGAPSEKTNSEFTEFCDNYLLTLFDICKQEVRQEWSSRVHTRDKLAIYSAGGRGRKLAFDDDYDFIVLLSSDDPEVRAYCGKILTRMNREIIKRGTMPHYRFADHFGEYVTTFSQLRSLFSSDDESVFIDMSQLLGARRIVGSMKLEEDLRREIIVPLILGRKQRFIEQLAGEIRSRHRAIEQGTIDALDVKENRGGLRDIELLLQILMAASDLSHPVTPELYSLLAERYPGWAPKLERLFEALRYLKRRRDIYRLTVAAEDCMLPAEMGHMARVLGYCGEPCEESGRTRLVDEMLATTSEVATIVEEILKEMGLG